VKTLAVALAALATAVATGLGALPFAFVDTMSRRWLGISNALAAGFMLSASGALVIEE
jgi:zinc transporter, ZIP family